MLFYLYGVTYILQIAIAHHEPDFLLHVSVHQEAVVKCEADSVLGEVRQKQSEAGRMLEVLAAVGSLRQARLKKKAAQGHVDSPTSGQQFNDALSEFYTVMKRYTNRLFLNHLSTE